MLKFIGSGSAFNTKLGNNSAYYKEGNQMLLIDCGSNIFQRIKENNLLEGIEHIHVLVTHTHADHVGSLADLILYTYYSHGEFAKNKITIYHPNKKNMYDFLTLIGCVHDKHYSLSSIPIHELKIITDDIEVLPFETEHVDEIDSYGFEIFIGVNTLYYSGDTSEINDLDLNGLRLDTYKEFYIDTCKADYDGNVHLSLRKLTELIEPDHRHKVWCMHLDEGFVREEAESLGFNVVTNEF